MPPLSVLLGASLAIIVVVIHMALGQPGLPVLAGALCTILLATILAMPGVGTRLRVLDWRVWAVILSGLVAIAATLVVLAMGVFRDPATFGGAVFAGWVSGLLLFAAVGLVVAVVSLVKPEEESFDARARILFKRQTGPHVDYIVGRLKETLEHYAESSSKTFVVNQFDAATQRYGVAQETETVIRSYVDDVSSSYRSQVEMKNVAQAPAGQSPNRMALLSIGAVSKPPQDFDTSISVPITTTISARGRLPLRLCYEIWVQAGSEPNRFTPIFYTQSVTLKIENRLSGGRDLIVRFSRDGSSFSDTPIAAGETKILLEERELPPGQQVYDFRLRG